MNWCHRNFDEPNLIFKRDFEGFQLKRTTAINKMLWHFQPSTETLMNWQNRSPEWTQKQRWVRRLCSKPWPRENVEC